jgi:hypothetical protein
MNFKPTKAQGGEIHAQNYIFEECIYDLVAVVMKDTVYWI